MEQRKSDLELLLEKKIIKCLLALVLPMIIMGLIAASAGIFSDSRQQTFLASDLNGQYISYLAYFRSQLLSGQLDFYTFTKTLGGDFYGFSAYYLFSPFNIVLLLFSAENITKAVYFITLLKIGTAGLTMYILLGKNYGYYYKNLIFSMAYALMAYNLAYHMHLMWLDAMVLLPLVVLGIDRIYAKKNSWMYIVALALTMMTCYYTGYMVCIFAVVYYGWRLLAEKRSFKDSLRSMASFGFGSLIGGGVSAFVWLPALMSLSGSKESSLSFSLGSLDFNFNPLDFIGKLFTGCYTVEEFENGMPNLYCGMLILLFLGIYFFQKGTRLREKIVSFLVIGFFFLSCFNRELTMVWHGFALPNGFKYRFSFIVTFFAILLAARGFYRMEEKDKVWRGYLPPVIGILGLAGLAAWRGAVYTKLGFLLLDSCCILVFAALLLAYKKKKNELQPVFLLAAGLIHVFCLYYNGCLYFEKQTYQQRDIEGYVTEMKPALQRVKQLDLDDFYRMEKNFFYSNNDAMLFDIYSLSHFSSTEKAEKKDWMTKMGYSNCNGFWVYYDKGSTIAAESLLGVRYLFDKEDKNNQNYEFMGKENGIGIYYNKYAMSLGFQAKDIKDFKGENPFDYQNRLFQKLTGEEEPVLKEVSEVEVEKKEETGSKVRITMEQEGPLYAYYSNGYEIKIYVNGKFWKEHLNPYGNGIVPLGWYKAGEEVEIQTEGGCDGLYFYQDMNAFEKQIEQLSENQFYIYEFSQDYIEGEYYNDGETDYLVFSIPYEEEWTVKVDTKKTETIAACGGLLAVPVAEGNHSVTLRYVTKGFREGFIISCGCIGLWAVVAVICFLKGRKREYEISSIPL